MKKILYFTAGPIPTGPEATAIAALNAQAAAQYVVGVRNGAIPAEYQPNPEDCDYVAGTLPAPYNNADAEAGRVYDKYDYTAPPAPGNLPATQTVVSDEQVIDTDDGGTVTLTVAGGAITAAVYAAGG